MEFHSILYCLSKKPFYTLTIRFFLNLVYSSTYFQSFSKKERERLGNTFLTVFLHEHDDVFEWVVSSIEHEMYVHTKFCQNQNDYNSILKLHTYYNG